MQYKRLLGTMCLIALPLFAFAQMKAEEIIKLMEKNEVHSTSKISGKLLITNRFGTKTKTFNAATQGNDKTLIEFTNKEERGQKILRLKDEIYVYYPKSNGVVRLQGGALKESIFGSDLTYEDLTGEKGLLDLYTVEFATAGTEAVDGTPCYHLKLTGKAAVAYPFQELWVEASRFVTRKAVYFSLTNQPLKEMDVKTTKELNGKVFPSDILMTDRHTAGRESIYAGET
jgi:outer membrane lipoprotein-sorting protein